MENIYGTIGYTLLEHNINKNKVIVLADMHNTLPSCKNKINIADWFKSKFNSSEIFLEEVPRENVKLKELWEHAPHTQELKNLYLNNMKIINALDIRPFMIPFSWEIVDDSNMDEYMILLKDYLKGINNFFCLKDSYLTSKLLCYSYENMKDTNIGKHFLKIKKTYYKYLSKYNNHLLDTIYKLKSDNNIILEDINDILNDIMEWYICAKIELKCKRPIIIHTGLFHSDNVIVWLIKHYNYNVLKKEGINTIEESETNTIDGCINIGNINSLF